VIDWHIDSVIEKLAHQAAYVPRALKQEIAANRQKLDERMDDFSYSLNGLSATLVSVADHGAGHPLWLMRGMPGLPAFVKNNVVRQTKTVVSQMR
jgi:hypothetical protein